jgi:hypothetical protein
MNKDINIVLNTIAASAADLDVAGGIVTIDDYSFPWKKLFSAEKKAAVTSAGAAITLTPASPSAGLEYRVIIKQYVNDEEKVISVGYVAVIGDTATTVCNKLRTLISAFVSAGSLDVTPSGTTTCIITSSATNPVINVGGLLNLTASAPSAGTAGVNEGATLLSEGVVDSFDGDLPLVGSEYTSYELSLKLPKGYGGFNGQTSDQEIKLNLYLDEAATNFAALEGDIDALLDGTDAVTAAWDFSDALAV